MSTIRRLLSQTADLVSGGETIDPTTRRPVESGVPYATGVKAAATKRADRTVIYDETGAVVTDYDVRLDLIDSTGNTYRAPTLGDRITVTGGGPTGEFVVSGETRKATRRTSARVLFYSVPCRRIDT